MSLNTKKQRNHLYSLSFLKWSVERRLSTLEKTSIESTLAIHKFGNDASEINFNKLCESLSDFETMLEVAEETFPALRGKMDMIKKQKLTVLKKQGTANKLEEQAKKIKENALKLPEIIKEQEEQAKNSKGLKRLLNL
jgi:hypothetical protein